MKRVSYKTKWLEANENIDRLQSQLASTVQQLERFRAVLGRHGEVVRDRLKSTPASVNTVALCELDYVAYECSLVQMLRYLPIEDTPIGPVGLMYRQHRVVQEDRNA